MTRAALAGLAALTGALLACAGPVPPPANPPAGEVRPGATTELTGVLSRKGPAETSFWAVTDSTGKVWIVVEVTPELEARFRKLQNGPVTVQVEGRGRAILDQVRVVAILRPAP